jgi:16S rRNA (guanine1516-N2)-methyltransferase
VTLETIEDRWALQSNIPKERPIFIDIDDELYRHEEYFKRNSIHKELLARAIGVKGSFRPRVADLTAGMLGDTLLMLSFGCEVTAIERNPLIALLIQSALKISIHPAIKKLNFKFSDAAEFMIKSPAIDTYYFDPMFDDPNTKSLPKKEMRIFRSFVGEDRDAKELLLLLRDRKQGRIVVKRPRLSEILAEKPDLNFIGKSTRYDVYLNP